MVVNTAMQSTFRVNYSISKTVIILFDILYVDVQRSDSQSFLQNSCFVTFGRSICEGIYF